ncbi:MAG: hypothetical protein AAGJ82_02915 [Bacteroidota bacterium]
MEQDRPLTLALVEEYLLTESPVIIQSTEQALHADTRKNGYLGATANLLRSKAKVLASSPPDIYYQSLAVGLAEMGCLLASQEAWSQQEEQVVCPEVDTAGIQNLTAIDAKAQIVAQAENHQIILINEAHHVPTHRRFTASLLKDLYQLGYRYLAAETMIHGRVKALNERKYPLKDSGTYTLEPQYGDLIRQALALGFEIVAYDANIGGNYSQRDSVQARNILTILERDSSAKILVHAGYGHIFEDTRNEWVKMGMYIRRLSGINPLTIDQTRFLRGEGQCYCNRLIAKYNPTSPTVWLTESGAVWTLPDLSSFVDIQVLHPQPERHNGRLLGVISDDKKIINLAAHENLNGKTTLVQCFLRNEFVLENNTQVLIPVDQFLKSPQQRNTPLLIPSGSFVVQWVSPSQEVLHTHELIGF